MAWLEYITNMYSNMKEIRNTCNCLRVIQQDKNRKLKNQNCNQRTSLIVLISLRKPHFLNNITEKLYKQELWFLYSTKCQRGVTKMYIYIYYILNREIQEFLEKKLFLRSLEVFISFREINLCRLDTFHVMVANI